MDDVLKLLRQIVSSLSEFGNVPKPVKICIGVFSGIFAFSLIFVYAHLDKKQMVLLIGAIALMAVVTGIYFLWNSRRPKEPEQDFWAGSQPPSPTATASRVARQEEPIRDQPRQPREPVRARVTQPSAPAASQSAAHTRPDGLTLLGLTEPLFQYVCRLNRIARRSPGAKSGETTTFLARAASGNPGPTRALLLDEVVTRAEIKALLEDMSAKAAVDLRLAQQVQKIELPLVFFVDSMISESALPFAAHWNQERLAYERQELAGDEKFFDLLDETLKENGEDAAERLAVFYICIGIGFTGIYFKQPELLRKTMLSIAPRIRHLVENDHAARICPETYQCLDTRDLVAPPSSRMVLVGLLFACATLAVMISYFVMYRQASSHLNHSIEEVLRQDLAADRSN